MSAIKPIKVILTDDHKIVTEGISLILENEEEIEVVGVAANGQELLTLLENTPADLVLLDIHMPVMDGCDAARLVQEQYPATKILALSMLEKEQYVRKIMDAGATGYILKSAGKSELVAAIKLVASGNKFMTAELFNRLLASSDQDDSERELTRARADKLSKRELEILNLIAEGFTNAEIADKLFVSKRTIETHRLNILDKTKTKNTANLIKYAISQGYIGIN